MAYQFHLQESSSLRSFLHCLSLVDGNDRPSSHVGYQPPLTIVKQPRTVKASTTPQQEPVFVMSVCMLQHISHLLRVLVNLVLVVFTAICALNQVWFKLDNNSGCFTWRPMYIYDHFCYELCYELWTKFWLFLRLWSFSNCLLRVFSVS